MGLCFNTGPSWKHDSLNEYHWACKDCIVLSMCTEDCYKTKLYHPYCEIVCHIVEQKMCIERNRRQKTSTKSCSLVQWKINEDSNKFSFPLIQK